MMNDPYLKEAESDEPKSNFFLHHISSIGDAEDSRDRGRFAVAILVFSIGATIVEAALKGMTIDPLGSVDLAAEKTGMFWIAAELLLLLLAVLAIFAMIETRNSKFAALSLLGISIATGLYWMVATAPALANASAATYLLLLIGFVFRAYVILAAVNCVRGVWAIRAFEAAAKEPLSGLERR